MGAQHTILLAEDDEFIRTAYAAGLALEGYKVLEASDGEEAIVCATTGKPDLILLDVIMPIKTGFEVLEDLQKSVELKDIPVVMFSNLSQKEDKEKALQLGAVEYINKDEVPMSEVIERIGALIP